jgi:hypothetical protein
MSVGPATISLSLFLVAVASTPVVCGGGGDHEDGTLPLVDCAKNCGMFFSWRRDLERELRPGPPIGETSPGRQT